MNIAHFLFSTELGHFLLYMAFMAFVSGMPAPTVTSSVAYRWTFASLNSFSMNFVRAFGSKVEKSPNFQDAIALQNGGTANAKPSVIGIGSVPGSDK